MAFSTNPPPYAPSTPVGMITPWAGSAAPADTTWLICDGQAVGRTTYAALFALIGTTYGAGNGSTTFNVPDLRGRVPLGVGTASPAVPGGTAHTLAQKAGEEKHTQTVAELALHDHPLVVENGGGGGTAIARAGGALVNTDAQWINDTGTSTPFNVLPPYLGLNFIIRAL